MLWGVRHANTQRQRQRQRQIHLGPEVESHYRPYMCYIFGKPWVQGPLWHCSPPPHTIYYDTVPPPQDDLQARRALGSRRPHSNRVSTCACDTRLNCIVVMSHILVWHYPPLVRSQRSNRVRHSSDSQARRALGSRRPHSNHASTSACYTLLKCIISIWHVVIWHYPPLVR